MHRRSSHTSEQSPERSSSSNSNGRADSSPGASSSTSGVSVVQFLPLRSRVGKRFQATLPDLVTISSGETGNENREKKVSLVQKKRHAPLLAKARFCPNRANELGPELDKYLKLAVSLRDGTTFDTVEHIQSMALQYLHRFNYNPTDAACSLYARHSIEVPKSASAASASPSLKLSTEDEANEWVAAFYKCMRLDVIDVEAFTVMKTLHEKAELAGSNIPATEAGVLARQVARIATWVESCAQVRNEKVDCAELLSLVHEAEDMHLVIAEKEMIERRLHEFQCALGRLKDALDKSNRRNQPKVQLDELESLYEAVLSPNIAFSDEERFFAIVNDAKDLRETISSILAEEKVSLPAMREVLSKIELVPVNFDKEVNLFQQKMLSAQNWLAKVRKCIPKRRPTRRGGSTEPKKLDLDAIRALVDDAPCHDSAEMFEMQDLLECADDWAERVMAAIEGGSDVNLDDLKELMEEGNDMPVDMEEQKFLTAEIAAREWSTKATSMLAARKPLKELEELVEQAKEIRQQIHPKKQSRWKPQIERDIHAAIDVARKWVFEVRDVLGSTFFDKLFPMSSFSFPSGHAKADTTLHDKTSKPIEVVSKLVEKADRLSVNVSAYTDPLKELLERGYGAEKEAMAILVKIGYLCESTETSEPGTVPWGQMNANTQSQETKTMGGITNKSNPKQNSDFTHACVLLEQIDGFPFSFEHGLSLRSLVQREKDWAQRVKDALPPRQSRKKRQASQITLSQLQELLQESKTLRFHFPEEIMILTKELEDVRIWQAKAHQVVESRVPDQLFPIVNRLKQFDIFVYRKIQVAKAVVPTATALSSVAPASVTGDGGTKNNAMTTNDDIEMNGSEISALKTENAEEKQLTALVTIPSNANTSQYYNESSEPVTVNSQLKQELPIEINVNGIMAQVRIESGCARKGRKDDAENLNTSSTLLKKKSATGDSCSLLEPILEMVEESLGMVNRLDFKEEKKKTVDELMLAENGANEKIPENITDQAVNVLDGWREEIAQVLEDSILLSAMPLEHELLGTVVNLLEWLQSARSIFYDEPLPLRELVVRGQSIEEELKRIRIQSSLNDETMAMLELMLWPLSYLDSHEKVVQNWTTRVQKCMADKRAPLEEVQLLLNEGSGLLMEPDAFKLIMDEVRKAKLWLSKLKKRLKSLITKQIGRLSMSVARSLVEEGEDIALDIPVFDFLKENVETASDWETRVLESGIETGQARIAHLLSLLNEYDCARLIIDLDMHRDVLKSATERYCICRQPFDGLMIGCDYCDDWFHDNCIGMSKEKAEKVENYTCPSCIVLQDLSFALKEAADGQQNLWKESDYVKNYEKMHSGALRRVKREEKAIERSEMLLFSCNNHLNQLQNRIDEIERAKSCLSIKNGVESGQLDQLARAAGVSSLPKSSIAGAPTVSSTSASSSVSSVPTAAVRAASGTTCDPISTANSVAGMNLINFAHQYPNILLPPARTSNITHNGSISLPPNSSGSTLSSNGSFNGEQTSSSKTNITNGDPGDKLLSETAPRVSESLPLLFTPMLAKFTENTERLSALMIAGGVEQQLTKLKSDHAEVKAQIQEIQDSLRLSRERLQTAQDSVKELAQAHDARHLGVPFARAWVRKVVTLLNSTSIISRSKLENGKYLPREYEDAITEISQTPCGIGNLFPEVGIHIRLLRIVGWSVVVVSLLQERPSREALTDAITYATKHNLWDGKTVSPLRAVIGRIDAWISKAQKCMMKSINRAQKITRLKLLLMEYSKLPLTCGVIGKLEEYINVCEAQVGGEKTAEAIQQLQDTAEAVAIAALGAVTTQTPASSTDSPGINPQKPPRKRKAYNRKEKLPAGNSAKKKIKPIINGSVSSSSTVPMANEEAMGETSNGTQDNNG